MGKGKRKEMNRSKTRLRILFLGTRKLGFVGLSTLVKQGFNIVGVVTKDFEITEGFTTKEFTSFCKQNKIPLFITEKIHSGPIYEQLKNLRFDMGISLYWKRLIKEPLIKLAPAGFINAHASDLPKYRGFAATSWSILLGNAYCGLCIHRVVPGIADNGNILRSCKISLDEDTTIKTLMDEVTRKSIEMTVDVLKEQETVWPDIVQGKEQNESKASLAYPRLPEDGEINWNHSAEEIHRHVRSVTNPYPGTFTWWKGQKVHIWKTKLVSEWPAFVGTPGHIAKIEKGGSIWVLTGCGVLEIQKISLNDTDEISPGEVIQSLQTRFGMHYSLEIEAIKNRLEKMEARLSCV